MTSRGTARLRCSAVLGRGHPLLCASPLLVSGEGWRCRGERWSLKGCEREVCRGIDGLQMSIKRPTSRGQTPIKMQHDRHNILHQKIGGTTSCSQGKRWNYTLFLS